MPYGFGYGNRFRDGSCRSFSYGPRGGGIGGRWPGFARGMGPYGREFYHDYPVAPEIERVDLQEYRSYLNDELELIKQRIQEVERRLEDLELQTKGE